MNCTAEPASNPTSAKPRRTGWYPWRQAPPAADLHRHRRHSRSPDTGSETRCKAHLEEADLRDVHLEKAFLFNAHLEGTRLLGAHLEEAFLSDANLKGADLRGAHLEKANLEGASLIEAHLEGASLGGANLKQTYLGGARLEGALVNEDTAWPEEFDWRAVGVIVEEEDTAPT